MQPGWTPIGPTYYNGLSISSGSPFWTNRNFTNDPVVQTGSVSGLKINQSCGCGIGGWTITLYNKTTGLFYASDVTNPDGSFAFTNVPFGSYYLNETPQAGWVQVTPNTTVTINATTPSITYDFINSQAGVCCECSPTAKFTYTKSGTTVNFKDATEGPVTVKWYWNFGDRTTSSLQNPSKTYNSPGTYTVTFYVKWADCNGATSTTWKIYTQKVTVP
jgi:PKD repeat protein